MVLEVTLENIAEGCEGVFCSSGRLDIGQVSERLEEEEGGASDDGVVEISFCWNM